MRIPNCELFKGFASPALFVDSTILLLQGEEAIGESVAKQAKKQLNVITNAPPSWLSSHPGGNERVSDLENLIIRSNYNRYAYEGVAPHVEIQTRLKKLFKEKKEREEKK